MLRPAEDRLNYSDMLTPPVGFEVEFAVGTTYSLDLEALIGVPLALSLSEEMDQTFQDNPIYILEGLRKSADKFAIFCEGGQIKVPHNGNNIFALLENSVFEVTLKNEHSFHPKIWVIKYNDADQNVFYRLLVLTRNLTFDRSWDMAIALEGKRNNKKTLKNRPLADFLHFLVPYTKNKQKQKQIKKLIAELDYVHFDPADKHIPEFEFCPLGIDGYGIEESGLFEKYHQLIVISPFLSQATVKEINKQAYSGAGKTLITRKSELHKLEPSMLTEFDVFALKDIIIEGEGAISEDHPEKEAVQAQQQDIHAKLYARTKYNEHHLYIGSANCSRNAFQGNVEFLLKLKYQKYGFRISHLLDDLFGEDEKENPFEKIETIPETNDSESDVTDKLEKAIKQLCRKKLQAIVLNDSEPYTICIEMDTLPEGIQFSIGPLLSKRMQLLKKEMIIENLSLLELGEFYKIRAEMDGEKVERIIKIPTEGIPEERDQEIFRSIIKDPYTFLKYVSFLLADDFLLSTLEQMDKKRLGTGAWNTGMGDYPVVYENMLKAASRTPEKLGDVKNVMNMINKEDIVPPEFQSLYETFVRAVKKVKK
ncbi:phospholipase D family protein [Neobacillus sp. SAB-20_R2A]|uniref:phospholipase D family protein n=1 Tax=Neobacillus sp. SAB-20_R2A TaxID=3120519 RepID=UPI003C6E3F34